MKNSIKKIVSWLMLSVFFVAVAPKEYLHDALYHHIDTVHPVYKKGEFAITKTHHHCGFLNFEFGAFLATEKPVFSFYTPAVFYSFEAVAYSYHFSSAHTAFSLRGPPACC